LVGILNKKKQKSTFFKDLVPIPQLLLREIRPPPPPPPPSKTSREFGNWGKSVAEILPEKLKRVWRNCVEVK
jgi:hypothetical protein